MSILQKKNSIAAFSLPSLFLMLELMYPKVEKTCSMPAFEATELSVVVLPYPELLCSQYVIVCPQYVIVCPPYVTSTNKKVLTLFTTFS